VTYNSSSSSVHATIIYAGATLEAEKIHMQIGGGMGCIPLKAPSKAEKQEENWRGRLAHGVEGQRDQ